MADGRLLWRVLAPVWMALILVECWSPRPSITAPTTDWGAHGMGFALLGLLLALAVDRDGARSGLLVVLLVGLVWSTVSELGQGFVPGRSVSGVDWAANVIGFGVGLGATWLGGKLRVRLGRLSQDLDAGGMHMGLVRDVNSASFDTEVLQSPTPVLVDFWAPWCQPCLMVAPVIDRLAERFAGRMKMVRVNIEDNPDLATRFGLRAIPILFFFNGGKVVNRLLGAQPEAAITRAIESVLA